MHSSSDLVSEYAAQTIIEAPEGVTANNREIMKQATILIKLIKYLDNDRRPRAYDDLVERITRKLEIHLDIWGLYLKRDEEELAASSLELERALESKALLRIRSEVGDVGDEEYRLKMASAEWSIENLEGKKSRLEGGVRAMGSLRGQLESEVMDEVYEVSRNDFEKIKRLELGSELTETIIKSVSKIADNLG